MKKLICIVLSLVMAIALCVAPTTACAEVSEFVLKDCVENVKIESRAAFTQRGLEVDFAGGGFSVSLDCEGDVELTLDWAGQKGRIGVIIDDDFDNHSLVAVNAEGEQTVKIAEDLNKGVHKIEVTKQDSQAFNQIVFKSLQFDGELLEKPKSKDFKIQFIGDSYSCGVGSDPEHGNVSGFSDVYYHSYNMYCARKLGAEISTCAIPGYGYYVGAVRGVSENMYDYLDKATVLQDIAYDNSQYIADVVVIELGINDQNYSLNNKIIVEDREAYASVQRYIDKIRSFNKDCYIVLMGYAKDINSRSSGKYFKLSKAVKRTVAVNEKVYYAEPTPISTTGIGYHPNVKEAKTLGEGLAKYITESVLSGKESPDAIEPKDFYLNNDVNGDDLVNATDVLYMRNMLVKKLKNVDLVYYDVNYDDKSDVKDLLDLRMKLAELI